MIQRHQKLSKIRFVERNKYIIVFNILVRLVILIIISFYALIINISRMVPNKIQKEDDSPPRLSRADMVCYGWKKCMFINKFPQVTRQKWGVFSTIDDMLATIFSKKKGLINQLKIASKRMVVLLKYRFFELRKSLEYFQAKGDNVAKLSQNKDSLSMEKGLVLGIKETDNSYYSSFQNAGMVHILVASGFNISLLAGYVSKFRSVFSRYQLNIYVLTIIWFYTWYLGGEPPLLRAAVMMTISLVLVSFGSKTHSKNILFYSGVLILITNFSLVSSLSFWFSFLATLGLVIFSNKFILFSSSKSNIFSFFKEEFFTSFSAQILLLPLVIHIFNEMNWLSFISNSLLLFPVAWFTQVGFSFFIILIAFSWSIFSRLIYPYLLIYREIISVFIEAVTGLKQLFFLKTGLLPEEKSFALICWVIVFLTIYLVTRIKHNKKRIFFHEKW